MRTLRPKVRRKWEPFAHKGFQGVLARPSPKAYYPQTPQGQTQREPCRRPFREKLHELFPRVRVAVTRSPEFKCLGSLFRSIRDAGGADVKSHLGPKTGNIHRLQIERFHQRHVAR